jgi:hypothetical protein
VANGEADATEPAYGRASTALRFARPAIVGLLLLIVIAGIGAASPASTGRGPLYHDAVAIAVALELVLAGLEIALAVMARRTAAAGHPARALRVVLRRAIAVAMVIIVVIAVANIAAHRGGSLLQRVLTGRHKTPPPKPAPLRLGLPRGAADHGSYLGYGVLGAIVLATLITLVLIVLRARTRPRRSGGYVDEPPGDERDDLRQAIDSGRLALHTMDDARAAIIACYVAMEGSLASAGATRAAAETPDELLTRAVRAGLVHSPAAATLTRLFYEARFSTHPVEPAAKDAAQQAMDAIAAELAGQAEAPGYSEPPAQTAP